jgi:hypothetical protein
MLTNEMLQQKAPSIFATAPESDVSSRYNFVPTIDVIDGLRDTGWLPVEVQQIGSRKHDNLLTNKHMIKFEHPELEPVNGTKIQSILINSHNRQSSLTFMLGLIEFACANGIITGDMFQKIAIRHSNSMINEAVTACQGIIEEAPQVMNRVGDFKQIELTKNEQNIFARSALNFRYGVHGSAEEKPVVVYGRPRNIALAEQEVEGTERKVAYIPFHPEQLLHTRRSADNNDSLWSVFNKIQENVIKGGARGMSEKWRRTSMREVKAIDENVKINNALWTMAAYMADNCEASKAA